MIEPFTEEEIEEALELFKKEWDECTDAERKRRGELLTRLQLPENSAEFLHRLTNMAQPRNMP